MHSRDCLALVFALLLCAPAAWGEVVKTEASPADAAMERAKRAAAGPLKAIQEAARIRRRASDGNGTAPVLVNPALATTAATAAPAAVERGEARATPPLVAPAPAAATAKLDAPAAAPVVEVAPLAVQSTTAVTLPAAVQTQPLLDTLPVQPKLVEMVEPKLPLQVMQQGPATLDVQAELSLRTDGSVAAVTLQSAVPRAWQRYIVNALEQWRFEPLLSARAHRVVLVFKNDAER